MKSYVWSGRFVYGLVLEACTLLCLNPTVKADPLGWDMPIITYVPGNRLLVLAGSINSQDKDQFEKSLEHFIENTGFSAANSKMIGSKIRIFRYFRSLQGVNLIVHMHAGSRVDLALYVDQDDHSPHQEVQEALKSAFIPLGFQPFDPSKEQ